MNKTNCPESHHLIYIRHKLEKYLQIVSDANAFICENTFPILSDFLRSLQFQETKAIDLIPKLEKNIILHLI